MQNICLSNKQDQIRLTPTSTENLTLKQLQDKSQIPQSINFCDDQHPFPYVYISNTQQNYRTPIVFRKVHKCGSSLVKNILDRYEQRYKHQVSVVEPSKGPWIGGYPGKFQAKFSYALNEITAGNQKMPYQSISAHMRWNLPELNNLYKNQPFFKVAIVRNPLSQWVSGYNFFYSRYKKIDRGYTLACRGSPFKEYVNNHNLLPGSNQSHLACLILLNLSKM